MEPIQRARFNADFTADKYAALVRAVNETAIWPADFRISETPIFLTADFAREIQTAAREIIAQVQTAEFREHARDAVPPELLVPNENPHPLFVSVDFGVCAGPDGRLVPRLIELQGFPSLYSYQLFFWRCVRDAFPNLPAGWQPFFSGLDDNSYLELLRSVIVGDADPENVILLEIEPEKQKTRIDFAFSESGLGVHPVCLTSIRKRGRQLFYERNGREIRIERIYNRVIFDELLRRPEFMSLLDDIGSLPDFCDRPAMSRSASLWVGPAGTRTPLHHDTLMLLHTQVVGRKRWRFVSPLSGPRVYNDFDVYSPVDFDKLDLARFPEAAKVKVLDVVVEPGETMFLPLAWWHQVSSLDVSLSFSFTNLDVPNHFVYQNPEIHNWA